jgi:hypothetical protein
MTAKITAFVSREQMKMRPPKKVSHNISPEDGGVAVHYGGGDPNPAPSSLDAAVKIWLGWQKYHMDTHGWNDIAYSFGFTDSGHVLAGRGLGVRTGGQGSNYGNDNYYAAVWVGGGSAKPTQKAYDALEWTILHARNKGRAGKRVRPHNDFTSTSCPGKYLNDKAEALDNKAIYLPNGGVVVPAPGFPLPKGHWYGQDDNTPNSHSGKQTKDQPSIKRIQAKVKVAQDGKFGPKTHAAVVAWQKANLKLLSDKKTNGKVGKVTWDAMF